MKDNLQQFQDYREWCILSNLKAHQYETLKRYIDESKNNVCDHCDCKVNTLSDNHFKSLGGLILCESCGNKLLSTFESTQYDTHPLMINGVGLEGDQWKEVYGVEHIIKKRKVKGK